MGLYSPNSRGGGGLYSRGAKKAKKGDSGPSPFGFIKNLGEDIGEAVTGLYPGIVATAKDPIKTLKQVGGTYAHMYGPALRGDFRKFGNNLYEDPLGPILDAVTVLTLGGAGAARGAALAGKAAPVRQLEFRSLRALETGEGPVAMGKVLSRNPVVRKRQEAVDTLLKRLPAETPIVGELARYGRELDRVARRKAMSLQTLGRDYMRAVERLRPEEMAALNLLARGISPRDYRRLLEGAEDTNPTMRQALANPELQELWQNPTKDMRRAHGFGRELSRLDADVKVERGWLRPETVEATPGRHRQIAEETLGDNLDAPPVEPYYTPDRMAADYVANADLARMGGGFGVPKRSGSLRRNEHLLFLTGRLAIEPDTLGPEFLRTIKTGLHEDIHNTLLDGAKRVERGTGLGKGLVYIRRPLVSRTGTTRPEQISYTQKTLGEFERDMERLVPDPDDLERSALSEGFTTRNPDEALAEGDVLYAVPEALAKRVAGEFQRSSQAFRLLWERPTNVWRALVLGYRPAFLVNNLVGNHLLYALRFAGLAGLRGYLDALRTVKGPQALRELANDPKTRDVIDQDMMAALFPEQVEGTFGRTQAFPKIRSPRVRRASRWAGTGIIPATQAASEGVLRRAGVNAAARSSPEVKAALRRMPRETRSFREATRQALDENPVLAREWSDRVNDALGNYLSLSNAERRGVRALIPFYAWYKAITVIALKLATGTPGRADLLTKVGQVGDELQEDQLGEVPSYLRGVMPGGGLAAGFLGEGEGTPIFRTQSLNPFSTIEDLGRSAGDFLFGAPGTAGETLGSNLNPIAQGLIEQLTGRTLFGGFPVERRVPGVIGGTVEGIVENLPMATLGRGPSDLYPERDLRSQLLAYLGIPVARLNPREAAKRAREEAAR